MPRLGFQQRKRGRFVFFPSPFSFTGAYEIPNAELPAIARAVFDQHRRSVVLYAMILAACLLLPWLAWRFLPFADLGGTEERAVVRKALQLGGICLGLAVVALVAQLRRRNFARRHLAGFSFAPQEVRAVFFRPGSADEAGRIRTVAVALIIIGLGAWALRSPQMIAAWTAGSAWRLIVEVEIVLILSLVVGYCGYLARYATKVRRKRVRHADATEVWAEPEFEVAPGHVMPKETPPRPLIWRVLSPDFGSGSLASWLEKVWTRMVWGILLIAVLTVWLLYETGKL